MIRPTDETWESIKNKATTGAMMSEDVMYDGKVMPMLVVNVRNGLGSKDYYLPLNDGVHYRWLYRN